MIRAYKDSDFEDVSYLNKISYEQPCTENELRAKLANPSWVWDAGEVLGCLITEFQKAETPEHPGKVFIWSITVAPPFRNKGIGAALIRAAVRHYEDIALWLYVDVDSDARKLYEREGFKVDQLLLNHYGKNEHAYLMVRR